MPGTRQAKSIATLMAFIWLFVLAVGAANACVLSARGAVASWPDRAAVSLSSLQAAPDSQEPGACAPACKSFCDSERSPVGTSAKTPDSPDNAPGLGAARLGRIHAAARGDEAAARQLAAAPPPRRAPAIQYLRLTL